jgi:formate hydrogenlyase transcriptional activator
VTNEDVVESEHGGVIGGKANRPQPALERMRFVKEEVGRNLLVAGLAYSVGSVFGLLEQNCCVFISARSSIVRHEVRMTSREKMLDSKNAIEPNGRALSGEHEDGFFRFARRLDGYREPEQLLRALSTELRSLLAGNTLALVFCGGSETPRWFAVDSNNEPIQVEPEIIKGHGSICSWANDHRRPYVVSALTQETPFSEFTSFFENRGDRSLGMFPLSTVTQFLGVLCIGRAEPDAFSEDDIRYSSLVADFVALAIDDRLVRAQLEDERTRLKLVLDLNNSVASSLELREVLRSISPSIRKVMRIDTVALALPERDGRQIRLYALDFPDGKGLIRQDTLTPTEGSLSGQVLRSGKVWVGDIDELRRSGFNHEAASGEGMESICMLPLCRRDRILGVLCLARLRKNAFTLPEIEFLSQIAGQIAIAIDNAFAYCQITELRDQLTQEKLYLQDELRSEMNYEEIIGNSAALRKVLRKVEAVAPTGSTVLIYGETGTGKELIARAVHSLSERRTNAFVKLNCAAIPTGLLESELFGHERGSFTGAVAQRIGRFELASLGTIFLDEVGEIPLDVQPKLLRVLQEREFERLGSSKTLRTDARLIAATNRDLGAMVSEQTFRSDLYYRLNVFPIRVPALRERAEDIPFLVRHFAQHFARNMKKQIDSISSETMNALLRYPWPGNIREMQNVIERAVILSRGSTLHVPSSDLRSRIGEVPEANGLATLEEVERKHIVTVLEQTNWVFAGPNGAAARLGLKRPTLQFRMQKLGITRPQRSVPVNGRMQSN